MDNKLTDHELMIDTQFKVRNAFRNMLSATSCQPSSGASFPHRTGAWKRCGGAQQPRPCCVRSAHLIPNGVPLPDRSANTDHLARLDIRPSGRYILAVARFVPEKGLHDLVAAFTAMEGDLQLVIAGDADHETDYSTKGCR